MSRYRVLGKPFGPPWEALLADFAVGEVANIELDEEQEETLVAAGVLSKVQSRKASSERTETGSDKSGEDAGSKSESGESQTGSGRGAGSRSSG